MLVTHYHGFLLLPTLGAIVVQFVAPDSFTFFLSVTFLVGLVVGGLASIPGAIFGGIFIVFIPNVAEEISKAAPWAIYGIFLIVVFLVYWALARMGMFRIVFLLIASDVRRFRPLMLLGVLEKLVTPALTRAVKATGASRALVAKAPRSSGTSMSRSSYRLER